MDYFGSYQINELIRLLLTAYRKLIYLLNPFQIFCCSYCTRRCHHRHHHRRRLFSPSIDNIACCFLLTINGYRYHLYPQPHTLHLHKVYEKKSLMQTRMLQKISVIFFFPFLIEIFFLLSHKQYKKQYTISSLL